VSDAEVILVKYDKIITYGDLEMILKKKTIDYFRVLFLHPPEGTEDILDRRGVLGLNLEICTNLAP
jgi:hypothetical protein